jgi:hypothetical protein
MVVEVLVIILMRNMGALREARAISMEQRRQIRETFFADKTSAPNSSTKTELPSEAQRSDLAS